MKRRLILLILIIYFSMYHTSSFNGQPGIDYEIENRKIIYALPGDFDDYSPWNANGYTDLQWLSAVKGSLYRRLPNGSYIPDLAMEDTHDLVLNKTDMVKIIQLQSNLQFWNGDPLTVDDVVFSYRVALTPGINKVSYSKYSSNFMSNNSITVESYSEQTIRFVFSTVNIYWQELMQLSIIQKSKFQDRYNSCIANEDKSCNWNAEDGSDANGAGPYYVDQIDLTNMEITVRYNPNYWDADDTWAEEIIFRYIQFQFQAIDAIEQGDIDIIDPNFGNIEQDFDGITNVNGTYVPDNIVREVGINHQNPYWGTGEKNPGIIDPNSTKANQSALNIRKAMSHIIDRKGWINLNFEGSGIPASTIVSAASFGYNSKLPARNYSIELARRYMELAGWNYSETDIDRQKNTSECSTSCFFNITILDTFSQHGSIAYYYETQLKQIGIGINSIQSNNIESRTWEHTGENPPSYEDGGYDIFLSYFVNQLDWNPSERLTKDGLCENNLDFCRNYYNYKNTTIEQLVTTYRSEFNFSKRMQILQDIQLALFHDIPIIPTFQLLDFWVWQENIRGLNPLFISNFMQNWQQLRKVEWQNPLIVLDGIELTRPDDLTIAKGHEVTLRWMISGISERFLYKIFSDGIEVKNGSIGNNEEITFNLNQYDSGNHEIILKVFIRDFVITDNVLIKVSESFPTVNSPNDLIIEQGSKDNQIKWIAKNISQYSVYRDGTVIENKLLSSSSNVEYQEIVVQLGFLNIGSYEFQILAKNIDGLSVEDSIIVEVIEPDKVKLDYKFDLSYFGSTLLLLVLLNRKKFYRNNYV